MRIEDAEEFVREIKSNGFEEYFTSLVKENWHFSFYLEEFTKKYIQLNRDINKVKAFYENKSSS